MWFDSFDELRDAGFKGFQAIAELRITCLLDVPRLPGVYVLVRDFPDRLDSFSQVPPATSGARTPLPFPHSGLAVRL
jgi:hypothetical protein